MKLYLMRHGIASESNGSSAETDSQRPLTAEGRDKINKIAHMLTRLKLKPSLILSSSFVRAEQTAVILAKEFDIKEKLKYSEQLVPDGKADAIINEIVEKYMVDELLVVSHEPCLSLLISTLIDGNLDFAINIKKGGVCCLLADDLRIERRATLEWLLTPKILLKV